MLRSKGFWVLALVGVGMLGLIGQVMSQESRPAGVGAGGADATTQERMEQFRQRSSDRLKEQLGITDDAEWAVLQPKVAELQTLTRQTRSSSGNMGGRMGRNAGGMGLGMGGGPGAGGPEAGGPGAGGPEAAAQPAADGSTATAAQSDVDKASQALQTVLQNKSATPDEIKAALAAYRDAKAKVQEKLEKLQKEVRELVTVRQEAVLVTMGLLN